MVLRISAVAAALSILIAGSAHAQIVTQVLDQVVPQSRSLTIFPNSRDEFVRQCMPRMEGRWAHPESVCGCLHDYAAASVEDKDLREALLRGISETGVPNIETEWVPPSKRSQISATFTQIAKSTLQCMFSPKT